MGGCHPFYCHGRIYSGHPRLAFKSARKTWIPAKRAGMTMVVYGLNPPNLSWPDLFRPSTACFQECKKDMVTRHKGGHDNGGLRGSIPPSCHGRIYSGHPRLAFKSARKTWIPATWAGMTMVVYGLNPPNLSWPDLFRPSTACFQECKKDVDTRHKGGHDSGGLGRHRSPNCHGRICSGHPRLKSLTVPQPCPVRSPERAARVSTQGPFRRTPAGASR